MYDITCADKILVEEFIKDKWIAEDFSYMFTYDSYYFVIERPAKKINIPKSCEIGCPLYSRCKYKADLEAARKLNYDFQVCNHNYYLADANLYHKKQRTLIPKQSVAVIDEAHKLTDAAMQIFGTTFDGDAITELAHALFNHSTGNKHQRIILKDKLRELMLFRDTLFRKLIEVSSIEDKEEENRQINTHIDKSAKETITDILRLLEGLYQYCEKDIRRNCNLKRLFDEVLTALPVFYDTKNIIYWLEDIEKVDSAKLCAIPTNIESKLAKVLWKNKVPKILTSGTLSDGKGFDFIKTSMGIDLVPKHTVNETSFASPFNYHDHSMLYISEKVPYPDKNDVNYIKELAKEIRRLINATAGHTAVLFTSYQLLAKVYEQIKDTISYTTIKMEKTTNNIVSDFKKSRNGVLFATGAFWEGVDCPGDILSSVIIVNLPFPVPSPVMEHKKKAYNSIKVFIDELVFPQMIIKLKQGMGRLIRNETDTGIVSILDYRVSAQGKYRNRVLNALLQYPMTDSIDDVKKAMRRWKDTDYFN